MIELVHPHYAPVTVTDMDVTVKLSNKTLKGLPMSKFSKNPFEPSGTTLFADLRYLASNLFSDLSAVDLVQVATGNNPAHFVALFDVRAFTGIDLAPLEAHPNRKYFNTVLEEAYPNGKQLVPKVHSVVSYWSTSPPVPCNLVISQVNPGQNGYHSMNQVKAMDDLRNGGAVIYFELDPRDLDDDFVAFAQAAGFEPQWYLSDRKHLWLFPISSSNYDNRNRIYDTYTQEVEDADFAGYVNLVLVLKKMNQIDGQQRKQIIKRAAVEDFIISETGRIKVPEPYDRETRGLIEKLRKEGIVK